MKVYAATIVLAFLAAACVGRSTPTAGSYNQSGRSYSNNNADQGAFENEEVNDLNSIPLHEATETGVSPDTYTIGPSDLLEVKAIESEKFTTTERVDMDGNINLPFLDDVNASNLTPVQAEQKIEDLLKEEGFIKDPHIIVFVAEHKSKTVSVLGYELTADSGDLVKYRDRIEARREVGRQEGEMLLYRDRGGNEKNTSSMRY